ncbi:MAG: GNAT family N-acetyltransferase [Lachnospiraceae bacterium]|nr:GNAT family N-acetyltransferase [Lachnospiraceae bacterium]MDE7275039.1 GNAT family N-acetyltransferase [Lachnospiraceae bacterium]
MEKAEWNYCREQFDVDSIEDDCIKKTEEILDFANMVFSMTYSSTDFADLLPKAYAPKRLHIPLHHLIKEDDKIKALVDTYPVILRLQGKSSSAIRAAYVGTVSVHPNARGRGYMIELMKRVEEDARKQGCALMILDGDRHRYQHYGFERAGIRYSFQVETGNIRHCCARIYDEAYMASPVYHFEELEEQGAHLDWLYALYERHRHVIARSREDFWFCLQSYRATAYTVLKDGKPVGYVNLSEDGKGITEFAFEDIQELPRILYDLMMGFAVEQIGINVGMDETDKIAQLEKVCDYCNASMSHQIKILDYEAVFGFLLNWKQQYSTLAINDYVLGVRDAQSGIVDNYLLSVTADKICVSRTDKAADVVLEALELVRLLTTNLCFVEQCKGIQGKIKNAPAGWFPLPFYLPEADAF